MCGLRAYALNDGTHRALLLFEQHGKHMHTENLRLPGIRCAAHGFAQRFLGLDG